MIITPEQAPQLSPVFKGSMGRLLLKLGLAVTGIGKINHTHQRVEEAGIAPGPDFAKAILDDFGIDFSIGNPDRLQALPEGPFITISNHNYGHLDGICLVDIIGHVRPKVKVMVNEFLMWVHGLSQNFISVNPTTTQKKTTATSINGIKNALLQIKSGEPLCLFPSGAVADLKPREHWTISERPWQEGALKLIRKARVPVVPIRFLDRNSNFYYALGLLDYRIRFVRLFHECYNKRGTHPRVAIGETIPVDALDAVPDSRLGDFLRGSVYDMPAPAYYVNRSELWK
ncbi:MAG: 1-acyl-sn-glycerol-3-phosphate acyltransferase [Bacteroidales bacterium]|nr:1-acyl-sn-glycerol-3-phosphate acyltransferase [Bacteroidales bacterium]